MAILSLPVRRRQRPMCASTFGTASCQQQVGHDYAHTAQVDGGLLAWENEYSLDGRTVAANDDRAPLPDGYEAIFRL